jgi:hypothetical protein
MTEIWSKHDAMKYYDKLNITLTKLCWQWEVAIIIIIITRGCLASKSCQWHSYGNLPTAAFSIINRTGDVAKPWVWKNDDLMSKYLAHTTPWSSECLTTERSCWRFQCTSKTYDTKMLMKQEYFILINNIQVVYANGDTPKYLCYIGTNTIWILLWHLLI